MKSKMKKQKSKYGITLAVALCISMMFFITGCGDLSKSDSEPDVKPPDPALNVTLHRVEPDPKYLDIFVSVTNEFSAPITDLTEDNFRILNDKLPSTIQPTAWNANLEDPFAATLLMDYSNSMSQKAKYRMELAAKAFINEIGQQTDGDNPNVVQIIKFATKFEVMAKFTNDIDLLTQAIEAETEKDISTKTSLYDVLHHAITETAKRPERRVILLVTDGKDKTSKFINDINSLIEYADKNGIKIYIIYHDKDGSEKESPEELMLKDWVEKTKGGFLKATGSSQYEVFYANFVKSLKGGYHIRCEANSQSSEKVNLELTVTDQRGLETTRTQDYDSNPNFPNINEAEIFNIPNIGTASITSIDTIDIEPPFGTPEYALVGLSGSNAGLRVIDFDFQQKPGEYTAIKIGGNENVRDIEIIFPYLYVAGYDQGLLIYDISEINPSNNSPIGRTTNFIKVTDVSVSGPFAYIMDEDKGLSVINVSNPLSPTSMVTNSSLKGSNLYAHNRMAYFIQGSTFYLAEYSKSGSLTSVNDTVLNGGSVRSTDFYYPYFSVSEENHNNALTAIDISNPINLDQFESYFIEPQPNPGPERYAMAFSFRQLNAFIATLDATNKNDSRVEFFDVVIGSKEGKPDFLDNLNSVPLGNINSPISILKAILLNDAIYAVTSKELRIFNIK